MILVMKLYLFRIFITLFLGWIVIAAAGGVTAAVYDFAGRNLPQNQPEKKHNEKTVAMDDEISKLQLEKDALDEDIARGEAAGQDISGQLSAAEDLKKEIEAKEKARDAELAKIPELEKILFQTLKGTRR